MFDKPTLLALVVTALFFVVAWATAAINPNSGRKFQVDSLKDKVDLHRRFARGQAPDDGKNASGGSKRVHRSAIDSMYDEGGSY